MGRQARGKTHCDYTTHQCVQNRTAQGCSLQHSRTKLITVHVNASLENKWGSLVPGWRHALPIGTQPLGKIRPIETKSYYFFKQSCILKILLDLKCYEHVQNILFSVLCYLFPYRPCGGVWAADKEKDSNICRMNH